MKISVALVLLLSIVAPAHAQLSTPNAAGVTFGHVHLNVSDIEAHRKLFVDVFGGVFVQRGILSVVKFPNMLVVFSRASNPRSSQAGVVDHFGFKVRDIATMRAQLEGLGYEVQREFTGVEGFPNAYVVGPDGLRLEMQQDTALTHKAIPNHVHFFTPDYEKLLDWYVKTFSLSKRSRGRMATTADAGTVNLSFSASTKQVFGTKGRTIDHIGFEVLDLEQFTKQLEGKGVKLEMPVRAVPSLALKAAYLTDPHGTYIELTEGLAAY